MSKVNKLPELINHKKLATAFTIIELSIEFKVIKLSRALNISPCCIASNVEKLCIVLIFKIHSIPFKIKILLIVSEFSKTLNAGSDNNIDSLLIFNKLCIIAGRVVLPSVSGFKVIFIEFDFKKSSIIFRIGKLFIVVGSSNESIEGESEII